MTESGAWLVPACNKMPCLEKLACYFKAVSISLALNSNPEAARLGPEALGVALHLPAPGGS